MNDRKYLYFSLIILAIAITIFAINRFIVKSDITSVERKKEIVFININNADKNELSRIPGIGESTAEKIILYRTENGEFEKIEDIMNIKGIKEKKFNKIKEYIYIENAYSEN